METQAIETQRVSMLWPAEIKEQVRQLVGSRGLTEFTLDAVRDKLAQVEGQPVTNATEPAPESESEPEAEPQSRPEPEPEHSASNGFAMDPADVAKLPMMERMAYAKTLIQGREGTAAPAGWSAELAAEQGRCATCRDELVNGECWTCPPV